MLFRWVFTVFTEMYSSLATSAVLSIPDRRLSTSRSRPLSCSTITGAASSVRGWPRPAGARADGSRLEQVLVGVGKLGVAPQHRADPGRLHGERQAELF